MSYCTFCALFPACRATLFEFWLIQLLLACFFLDLCCRAALWLLAVRSLCGAALHSCTVKFIMLLFIRYYVAFCIILYFVLHYERFPLNFFLACSRSKTESVTNCFFLSFKCSFWIPTTGDDENDLYFEKRKVKLRRAQNEKHKMQMWFYVLVFFLYVFVYLHIVYGSFELILLKYIRIFVQNSICNSFLTIPMMLPGTSQGRSRIALNHYVD